MVERRTRGVQQSRAGYRILDERAAGLLYGRVRHPPFSTTGAMSTTLPRRLLRLTVGTCLPAALPAALAAQQPGARPGARAAAGPDTGERIPPSDTMPLHVVTHHAVTIDGQRVEYDATLGSIIL